MDRRFNQTLFVFISCVVAFESQAVTRVSIAVLSKIYQYNFHEQNTKEIMAVNESLYVTKIHVNSQKNFAFILPRRKQYLF